MRLADILFTQGFGTRFDCQQLVLTGQISVQGVTLEDPNADFDTEGFSFVYRDQLWPYKEKAIIALHKPAGYECSLKPSAHPSVMTLIPGPLRRRNVQPVGRLDVDTTGLLLMTDDGALLHRLIHPKRHVSKTYRVGCKHPVTEKMLEQLLEGVVLADDPKPVSAHAVTLLDEYTIEMVLTQGKYHQVKRMVAACSNRVESLHRTGFGQFQLPESLAEGTWQWIEQSDILG
ncbi:MAG: 16S rRNA pseudouridine(516) synthase [Sutterella sp.]|nr:16S rRNA pseudouridine(516) synthase [Sutterella sp.]